MWHGSHLAVLGAYFWLCVQRSPLVGLEGTVWDAGDRTSVSHVQGKRSAHYTSSLAPSFDVP